VVEADWEASDAAEAGLVGREDWVAVGVLVCEKAAVVVITAKKREKPNSHA
jgi:hypothetical protein